MMRTAATTHRPILLLAETELRTVGGAGATDYEINPPSKLDFMHDSGDLYPDTAPGFSNDWMRMI